MSDPVTHEIDPEVKALDDYLSGRMGRPQDTPTFGKFRRALRKLRARAEAAEAERDALRNEKAAARPDASRLPDGPGAWQARFDAALRAIEEQGPCLVHDDCGLPAAHRRDDALVGMMASGEPLFRVADWYDVPWQEVIAHTVVHAILNARQSRSAGEAAGRAPTSSSPSPSDGEG